ncbi:hypothetical protein MMC17_002566 [Xylographa soralifera]|nr:hypothetical protein [Xylographa soralifera]
MKAGTAANYTKLEDGGLNKKKRYRGDQLVGGWRTGVLIGAIVTLLVLIANIAILAWSSIHMLVDNGNGTITLYNSVVFSTVVANNYYEILVAEDFLGGSPWSTDGLMKDTLVQDFQDNIGSLVKMNNADCISTYYTSVVSDYQNVLLVTNAYNSTDSILAINPQPVGTMRGSVCLNSFFCGNNIDAANPTNWTFDVFSSSEAFFPLSAFHGAGLRVPVNYCLVQPAKPAYTVGLSRVLLGFVIICNIVKFACLISTLILTTQDPLVTVGDAIASFLQSGNPNTWHGPLSVVQVRTMRHGQKWQWLTIPSMSWTPTQHFWFAAASKRRWISNPHLARHPDSPNQKVHFAWLRNWSLTFGVLNLDSLLFTTPMSLIAATLLTNTPQILLSLLYVGYNALFTTMFLSAEYLSYATTRKPLRVSRPAGMQRSTYYLQLPYRYSIPLLCGFAGLHWFVSQTIFLAKIDIVDPSGVVEDGKSLIGPAWGPVGMVGTVGLGGVLTLLLFICACRRYGPGMPVAGSCSAAISAACHRADKESVNVVLQPLMYGVLAHERGASKETLRVGFSAGKVTKLVEGEVYD